MAFADITKALELAPQGGWSHGDRRSTPTGILLDGFRDSTYWYTEIAHGQDVGLVEVLDAHLGYLETKKAFMREISSTGGSAEYIVGWFATETPGGETMPSKLLGRMAALGIDLSVDVYPPDDMRVDQKEGNGSA